MESRHWDKFYIEQLFNFYKNNTDEDDDDDDDDNDDGDDYNLKSGRLRAGTTPSPLFHSFAQPT